jgi:signal transduction histidine kinase
MMSRKHGLGRCCTIAAKWLSALGAVLVLGGPLGLRLDAADATLTSSPAPTNTLGLGAWIWDSQTYDKQICRLWRNFDIPETATVNEALLRITADNGYRLFLDGREVGRGSDWRALTEYNLTWLLQPGNHVLAVEGFNDQDKAGVILGLSIQFTNGEIMEVRSDTSWRVVPPNVIDWQRQTQASPAWPAATKVGALGDAPWWSNPLRVTLAAPLHPIPLHFWERGWFQVTLAAVCVCVLAVCFRLAAQLALQSNAQRLLQLERARIARDIHDELGAGLTQLVLLGEVTQSQLPPESNTRVEVNELCERARSLSRTMDEIVWVVNSRRDTLRDFVSYICKYAESFLRDAFIRCRFDLDPALPTLPFDLPIRRNLFLAVKEALNNVAKHSGATEVFLRIHRQDGGLRVIVEDNGHGFDLAHADPDRNGLTNMSQRMADIGGTCRFSSRSGGGCSVEFTIPALSGGKPSGGASARRPSPLTASSPAYIESH